MRKRRRTAVSPSLSFYLLLCALLPLGVGRAQQAGQQVGPVAPETGVIAGVVTAQETGLALPEVRVTVAGTGLGATADHDGRFAIAQVPPGTHRLQARLIGYEVGEVAGVVVAPGQTATANLHLQPLPVALQEVVVVGYGTQVRRDITGSISSVAAADLKSTPTVNTVGAIQGRVAGVDIVTTGQKPGDGVRVRVRGARSVTAGNDPLYVVDGIPAAGVTDLNPNDIASIEVLKDASATAIYGSRGANGVVLVTTKQGSAGPTTFTYDSYVGVQRERSRIQMMNGQQYAQLKRDANRTTGNYHCDAGVAACDSGDAQIFLPVELASIQAGRSTNWQDLVLRQGQQVNNEIRIAGGDERTRFALSGGQLTQQGILQGQDFTRRSVRFNFNHELNDRLKVGTSASLVRTDQNLGRGDGIYSEALLNNPLAVPYDSAGNLLFKPTPDGQRVNPLSDVQNWVDNRANTLVSGTLFADYRLTDALSWRVNFGGNVSSNRRGVFQGAQTQVNQGSGADAGLWENRTTAYTLDNILTFRRNVGSDHRVDLTLLYSIQQQRTEDDTMHAAGLPYERQQFYDIGSATHIDGLYSDLTAWALQSYMARLNYAFKDKYLLTLTTRVDGSSRLARGHKYAMFPSVALAWRLSEEGFIRRTNLFSDLKLRASYGHTGNTAIDPYQTLGSMTRVMYSYNNNAAPGYRPGSLPNPDLKWENTGQLDLGLEFTALRGRLSGSVDYYRADTKDLIMRRQIPPTNGYTSILQNIGSTRNTGLEVALSVVPIEDWHGLRWSQDLNWSTNHNRIVSLYGGVNDVLNKWFIGQPIDVYYDNKFVGIWQAQDSLLAKQYKAKPGQIRVADVNGDGKIDGNDRVILGTPFPAWTGSMTSRFDWKRFDLSLMTVARVDFMANDQFLVGESTMQGRYNNLVTDYWTPTHPSNVESRPTFNQENPPFGDTRRYEDGSFIRVRSITLGYTLPGVHGGPWHARSLRFYVTALDPFLFTRFRGLDPESRTGTGDRTSAGYAEAAATPSYWTLLTGVTLSF
ncbi:MAG: SusC/RagA family TonB-linked outer membrane protein [Gemmatimonadetes bacterium]|nr:MAG: SusC/RagA family TonB-linked outer membrane protein [Gemmatimonadota bacterium]